MSNTSRTDWNRIDRMGDEEIDTSDIPPLTDEFFAKAQLRVPKSFLKVSIQVDKLKTIYIQAGVRDEIAIVIDEDGIWEFVP